MWIRTEHFRTGWSCSLLWLKSRTGWKVEQTTLVLAFQNIPISNPYRSYTFQIVYRRHSPPTSTRRRTNLCGSHSEGQTGAKWNLFSTRQGKSAHHPFFRLGDVRLPAARVHADPLARHVNIDEAGIRTPLSSRSSARVGRLHCRLTGSLAIRLSTTARIRAKEQQIRPSFTKALQSSLQS
jgi:hypothetical protein